MSLFTIFGRSAVAADEAVRLFVRALVRTVRHTVGDLVARDLVNGVFPQGMDALAAEGDAVPPLGRERAKQVVANITRRITHDFGFTIAERSLESSLEAAFKKAPDEDTLREIFSVVPENYLEGEKAKLLSKPELEDSVVRKTISLMRTLGELENARLELRDKEERFRAMVQKSSDITMIIDDAFRTTYVSPSVERVLGYHGEELNGVELLSVIHPDDSSHVRECFGSIIGGSVECPPVIYRFRKRNGEWAHLEVVASPLVERPLHGIILNARDVSERVRSEARIRELNELRSKFIEIVSHQLRTPLTAIRWNLEAMLAGDMGTLTDAQVEFLRVTYDADVEIIERIHDLLSAMDIEEGRVVLNKSASSLEGLWGSVFLNWKKQCAIKRISCEYEGPPEPIATLEIDADKVRYVLEKLMQNAVMYTPSSGKIRARIFQKGGRVRFEIADSGIGIPTQEQPRIFSRFFRASNATNAQPDASGLGLSIARFFVERHGGTIGFTSSEGTGTTFWFDLPTSPAS